MIVSNSAFATSFLHYMMLCITSVGTTEYGPPLPLPPSSYHQKATVLKAANML